MLNTCSGGVTVVNIDNGFGAALAATLINRVGSKRRTLMAKRSLTSGRARRAMKMGELASQVGSSYLWTQLRRPFLNAPARERELLETHIKNAQRIVEGSTQLRGAFLKLIQMLSMRKDLLPGEALDVLRRRNRACRR